MKIHANQSEILRNTGEQTEAICSLPTDSIIISLIEEKILLEEKRMYKGG